MLIQLLEDLDKYNADIGPLRERGEKEILDILKAYSGRWKSNFEEAKKLHAAAVADPESFANLSLD